MMVIIYKDKTLWLPEAAGITLDILFDIHFLYIVEKRKYKIYKKVKRTYKDIAPLYMQLEISNAIRSIKKGIKPNKDYHTIVNEKYLKITYYNSKKLEIENEVLYASYGYLEFVGYDDEGNLAYKAYLFDEGYLLKLLYAMYNPPKKEQREIQ